MTIDARSVEKKARKQWTTYTVDVFTIFINFFFLTETTVQMIPT